MDTDNSNETNKNFVQLVQNSDEISEERIKGKVKHTE